MGWDETYARLLRKIVLERDPTVLSELVVAVAAIFLGVLVRFAIEWSGGNVFPFLMTYPATMIAVLLAGYRPASAVAIAGIILNLQHVLPRWSPDRPILTFETLANFLITALSLTIIIWVTSAFRRASIRLRDHSRREIETLGLLIDEMDHRTKNNFQIAAIFLDRAIHPNQSAETISDIKRAKSRLLLIAKSYENLSTSSENARISSLDEHIYRITKSFEAGFLPDNITLSVHADRIFLDQQCNLVIGLIIGEWMTNSIKYAFEDAPGQIIVSATHARKHLIVVVSDDGKTVKTGNICAGSGSKLVQSLAKTIGASVETEYVGGARCSLILPI